MVTPAAAATWADMRTATRLVLIVIAVALVAAPDASASTTRTERYEAGTLPTYWPQCYANGAPLRPSYGGACFELPAGVERIDVTIHDANTRRAPGRILFTTGYDTEEVGPVFCGSVTDVPVPTGTLGINISTSPLRTSGACGIATATSGTITVEFN